MFSTLLVANRGEIACRVMRTARRLGIRTIAVYSEADADALHVREADEAWPIGPAPARDSYLCIDRIIEAACRSAAEAVHPGYGFLSENAAFAEACAEAGIVLVGPPAAAMRAMGSKAASKTLMEKSGVPLVPGYHGEDQSPALLADAAARIGFPVLIKASAGGGGKGMRIVERAADFAAALEGAQREGAASFGDARVLVEKYLTRPRHIEIQVFADTHGNTVTLFERDCSVQRRHQKVLEEAPAPGLSEARRAAMGEAACAAARAVGYIGAGTVEFIAEGDAFYFMEMNTRLQVEHPVTEMITGLDLVEWQLRVAAGEPLPLPPEGLRIRGHAIEARIYAEDPARNYLPSIGRLTHLRAPRESAIVRVDTGVRRGHSITPYYDPMIAKLIVHGPDRTAALRTLRDALAQYEVAGVETNLGLLRAVAADAEFAAGGVDTGYLGRHPELLASAEAGGTAEDAAIWLAAALHAAEGERPRRNPASPWDVGDAWRLNGAGYQDFVLHRNGTERRIRLSPCAEFYAATWDGGSAACGLRRERDGVRLSVDGVIHRLRLVPTQGGVIVILGGRNHAVRVVDPLAPPASQGAGDDRLSAPIPARVVRVLTETGATVKKGTPLVVLEAMKMELTLSAPMDGVVASLRHKVGDMVQEGADLVIFEPAQ